MISYAKAILAPCPWCAKKPHWIGGARWRLYCDHGALIDAKGYGLVRGPERKTQRGAINAWNKRLCR